MPLPDLSVRREFSAHGLNIIVNHPGVRPWVGAPGTDRIDLSAVVADSRNVLLMADGGAFFLTMQEPGIYEVHSQFLPEHRGENVIAAAHDASRYMFTRTDCVEIRTKVPEGNIAAGALAKRMGWGLLFSRDKAWPTDEGLVGCRYYSKTIDQWAAAAPGITDSGAWFHRKLEAAKVASGSELPVHDDDDAHDRYVGATVEMIAAGQIAKGLGFYNRWAPFAGYGPVSLVAMNPPVIDIGDALLAVRGDDFHVILCR